MKSDNCPMGYKDIDCKDCPGGFSKEGLCDHPYSVRECPGKENCEKIAAVLDQQLEIPAMYPMLINKTCLECAENPVICVSKIGY